MSARATYAPCCFATGAIPGWGAPPGFVANAVSPITKMSACPGARRSGWTGTRPARSPSIPSQRAAGDARTPAAQTTVPARMTSSPMRMPSASQWVTACPSRTSTPMRARASAVYRESVCGKVASRRGPASTSSTRVCAGSMTRKSRASARRASSATAPASSTPVGPPPTIAIVSRRAHSSGFDRSEEHTSELQSQSNLVCRLLLEKKKQPVEARGGVPGHDRHDVEQDEQREDADQRAEEAGKDEVLLGVDPHGLERAHLAQHLVGR